MLNDFIVDMARIAESALSGDRTRACAYIDNLAKKLESAGETKAAKRIRDILQGNGSGFAGLAYATIATKPIPVDTDSGMPIAEEHSFERDTVPLSLCQEAEECIGRFLAYFEAQAKLLQHGVSFVPSLLLYGPPGCGKTQIAKFISAQSGLPLVIARMDGLISSYLGSTSKNLRKLFDHISSHQCILFLDEFDALAKMRDDDRELGELKRVVISLLQNIDSLNGGHILLAATNHEHLLDPAIWRRFSYKLQLTPPENHARRNLYERFLGKYADPETLDLLASISEGLTGSQIQDYAIEAVRYAVIHDLEQIDFFNLIRSIISVNDPTKIMNVTNAVSWLNEKNFTQTKISSILGISQPRVSQILKELRNDNRKTG